MKTLTGKLGSWEVEHLHRWKDREILPSYIPVPLFDMNTRIATIGSCFAENVATVLHKWGYNVAMHPAGLWYNTYSIEQEIRNLFEDSPYEDESYWQMDDGQWVCPFKSYFKRFATREEAIAWSDEIDQKAKELFSNAEMIIITLGLIEIWESIKTGNVFLQLPPPDIHRKGIARFRASTVAENRDNLEKLYATIRRYSEAQIVITVSPVPLNATFRNLDIRIANNISKSTLRVATAEFIESHPDVHYFHSYEIVMSTERPGLFMKPDGRHVREIGVRTIMNEFIRCYGDPLLNPPSTDLSWLEDVYITDEENFTKSTIINRILRRFRRELLRVQYKIRKHL